MSQKKTDAQENEIKFNNTNYDDKKIYTQVYL